MSDAQADFRMARLRCGLLRRLANRKFGYASELHTGFPWSTDNEFNSCVSQLLAENLIVEQIGREGGMRLALTETTQKEATNG